MVPTFTFDRIADTGLMLITPGRLEDGRGWLSEVYSESAFSQAGVADRFVQENASRTREPGVIRGLHFQRPPAAQAKLFRVVRGEVLHAAVDLRPGAFGRLDIRELSEVSGGWIYLPAGFAHGFQTLTADVEVVWRLSAAFSPGHQGTLQWDDASVGIPWRTPARRDLVSARDQAGSPLAALAGLF